MKWYLATDEQLETIFNADTDCPNPLLVGVVSEMLTRGLLDGMIQHMAKKFSSQLNRDEMYQAAYIGIYQLAKIYKYTQLTFKQMTYIAIERRIKSLLQQKYSHHAHLNDGALMNEMPVMESSVNVEKTVIRKVMLEEQLSKLTKKQRNIIELYLKGYSLRWIGANVYQQDTSSIHYQFKKALGNMNITDFEIGRGHWKKGA
jgi:RNA polymerase sigma factor (sigma-70 family)